MLSGRKPSSHMSSWIRRNKGLITKKKKHTKKPNVIKGGHKFIDYLKISTTPTKMRQCGCWDISIFGKINITLIPPCIQNDRYFDDESDKILHVKLKASQL